MKKKFIKSVAAALATVVLVGGSTTVSASTSYSLRFTSGAPASTDILSTNMTLTGTGGDYLHITSYSFQTAIAGASASASCSSYPLSSNGWSGTGNMDIPFTGSTVPRKNTTVYIKVALKDYSSSGSVSTNGTGRL